MWISIFSICFLSLIAWSLFFKKNKINMTQPKETKYPIFINDLEYFAGFSDIAYSKCYIELFSDKLQLIMKNSKSQTRNIAYKDIDDITFVSETEIKKVPSVAKLVLLGVWGLLGDGKEKKVAVDYLVINCKNGDNIVLSANDRASVKWKIKGEISKYIYKQNNLKQEQL